MRPTLPVFAAALALAAPLIAPAARAQGTTIINTFAPGDAYSVVTGNVVAGANAFAPTVTANQFTVSGPGLGLGSITLAMGLLSQAGTNVFDLDVETSVPFSSFSTTPKPSGVVLESFHVTGQMAFYRQPGPAITVTSVTHPLLQPDVTYWVVASVPDPATEASWYNSSVPDSTPYGLAQRNPAGGVWGYGNGHDAFRVTGIAAAPEPSSVAGMALGALGLAVLAVRVRRRPA